MSPNNAPDSTNEPHELQFDRVEMTHASGDPAASPKVTCVVCRSSVVDSYYAANDKPICASCRDVVMSAVATPRSPGPLLLAGVLGLGAALAGAAIYYAAIAIAKLSIGIVAILIGYMVGWAVRKGTAGRGGRRFQILAVVLTYWAVGLAYTPGALKQMAGTKKETSAGMLAADSGRGPTVGELLGDSTLVAAPAVDSTTTTSADKVVLWGRRVQAIGALALLVFTLPVLSTLGSLPYGFITAVIIFIGMRQAWQMTAPASRLAISGPYKVGTGPAPISG